MRRECRGYQKACHGAWVMRWATLRGVAAASLNMCSARTIAVYGCNPAQANFTWQSFKMLPQSHSPPASLTYPVCWKKSSRWTLDQAMRSNMWRIMGVYTKNIWASSIVTNHGTSKGSGSAMADHVHGEHHALGREVGRGHGVDDDEPAFGQPAGELQAVLGQGKEAA